MAMVISGEIKSGDKIKSVREMSIEQKVNPKTIQKAFDYLDEEGIFHSVIGGGRYLSDNKNIIEEIKRQLVLSQTLEFVNKMNEYGYSEEEVIKLIKEAYEQ